MKISKQSAEHYRGDKCDGWRLVNQNDLSVIHERMPPNTSEVRHYHTKSRQFFFVLIGTATLEIDGQLENIAPGSVAKFEKSINRLVNEEQCLGNS
ncbi:cupin domain-containing protein [Bacillus bingmayongensis]|uniref:cupin domain-containing protein n=1 Tax=Bacillus bingmayongensis TaxID=1150157 RepID=UPI0002E81A0C|nr:cupin domain-containing protein [Bacillus bingmayongensis]